MTLKYAIIGAGALGGYYGGRLAQAGSDVHFLFNTDYTYVCDNGFRVDSVSGNFHLSKLNAYNSTSAMPVCDVVLVCLKTTNNHLLPELLKPILHANTLVVLVQNGLGLEESLERHLPDIQLAGGLAFICSNKIGPGHIRHLDLGKLVLGAHKMNQPEVLQQVCRDFQQAGVPCQMSDDLYFSRWQKLVWNVPFNGLTVVLNTTTDRIMANHSSRELAFELMLEVVAAANQCGVKLEESFARKMLDMTAGMTPYAPSMKLDFDFKRPMEIEAIYSNPVSKAAEAGFAMKQVAMLEKQLRFIQAQLA
ncbi:putative 2-dehydropantoate 2-reductase [Gaoshiqia sediminis]|uniref:2-dehydropantoate 2-reductase n=1 Tax=Gaoshiqia sediminis TaxID=2986998 RepID=A0AA42CA51_9BACT|nr:putative 2-dehydropantoate 2-reductase [Gaoshiqia sediminis]MCW0483302.1 putative 2-dehydropantoate 2-reductase [Gaoshiqia sediminis]